MADNLTAEVVSPEKRAWSCEANMVSARTLGGDLWILPDDAPLLGVLVYGVVWIKVLGSKKLHFNVNGGFISVAKNRVSILGENAN